jgi:CubicO group peptidase (beta-lactamase class C family)
MTSIQHTRVRRWRRLACSVFVLGLPLRSGAQSGSLVTRVDAYFAAAVRSSEFSGVVLVARGDSILVRRAYGFANTELAVRMTPEHRFLIASLTKTFTGAAISLLAKDGTLRLQDSLARFLPEFPNAEKIRIEHLLLHSSGVRNPEYEPVYGKQYSLTEVVAAISARPLQFEPGSSGAYSNGGYNLLAAVIERATGRPYPSVVRERIFQPLGLTSTGDAADGAAVPGLATAYVEGPPPSQVRPVIANSSQAPGSGSAYSTVDDLFRWARALQQRRPVDPRETRYPYGWGRRERAGGVWLEQTGMIDGWTSNVYLGLDSMIVVVALANRQAATFGRWGREIAGMVMGERVEPLASGAPAATLSAPVADYVGTYSGSFGLRITTIGGHVYAEVAEWPVTRYLRPTERDAFVIGDFGEPLKFERDTSGLVTAAVWGTGESAMRFQRAPRKGLSQPNR